MYLSVFKCLTILIYHVIRVIFSQHFDLFIINNCISKFPLLILVNHLESIFSYGTIFINGTYFLFFKPSFLELKQNFPLFSPLFNIKIHKSYSKILKCHLSEDVCHKYQSRVMKSCSNATNFCFNPIYSVILAF